MSTDFVPANEQGVVVVFAAKAQAAGWEFVSISASFPDAVLRKDGEEWRTEFEYRASNFLDHRHDHRECDMVICWENDYPDNPLPTLELSNEDWVRISPSKVSSDTVAVEYWKRRALRAEAQARNDSSTQAARIVSADTRAVSKKMMALDLNTQGTAAIEIAKMLNVPPATVRSWIARHRAKQNGGAHE